MKIAITAETTIDITDELKKKFDIKTIPLFVRLGDEECIDGEFEVDKIFNYVKTTKQLPKTSAPNNQNYQDFFEETLKEYDAVIHFSISGDISSSFSHAKDVSESLKNVYVVDSRTLSTGIALLCIKAREMANQNIPIEKIIEEINILIPKVQASFVLTELNYLYKGGRCSSLALLGSNILKIRPQILVQNGTMKSGKKFIGSVDNSYIKYVNTTLEEFNNPDKEHVFLTYTTCKPEIENQIKAILKEHGFKNIYVTQAGATITSYCGENCMGILFINN